MTTRQGTKPITVSIDADLADKLDQVADERMVGKALLVEKALKAYLPTLPPVEPVSTPVED